jgi:hypothetical protein
MTIKELLKADNNICELEVNIFDKRNHFKICYAIGRDVAPIKAIKLTYRTKIGDMYEIRRNNYEPIKTLYIKRIIQYTQLNAEEKAKRKNIVGVLIDEIPKEILELEVDKIMPYKREHMGGHGYYINCVHPMWQGLPGEDEVIDDESGIN